MPLSYRRFTTRDVIRELRFIISYAINNFMKDYAFLKEKYRKMERNVLVLILLPLPFFAVVYLNTTKPIRTLDIPELPGFLDTFFLSLTMALLIFQQINFQNRIKALKAEGISFEEKVLGYFRATTTRYLILGLVGFIAALGLLFYGNVAYTVAYAIVLVLVSVLKPSPIRIVRMFHFKGEEKDFIYTINRQYLDEDKK